LEFSLLQKEVGEFENCSADVGIVDPELVGGNLGHALPADFREHRLMGDVDN
jgi:hypothetical protein